MTLGGVDPRPRPADAYRYVLMCVSAGRSARRGDLHHARGWRFGCRRPSVRLAVYCAHRDAPRCPRTPGGGVGTKRARAAGAGRAEWSLLILLVRSCRCASPVGLEDSVAYVAAPRAWSRAAPKPYGRRCGAVALAARALKSCAAPSRTRAGPPLQKKEQSAAYRAYPAAPRRRRTPGGSTGRGDRGAGAENAARRCLVRAGGGRRRNGRNTRIATPRVRIRAGADRG
jgi:hypothetical protein